MTSSTKLSTQENENICVQNYLNKNDCSCLSYNREILETTQISIDKKMNKQMIVCLCNGVLTSNTKEQTAIILQKHYLHKRSQTFKDMCYMLPLT